MDLDYVKRKKAPFLWIWIALGFLAVAVLGMLFSLLSQAIPVSGATLSYAAIFKAFGDCFAGPFGGQAVDVALHRACRHDRLYCFGCRDCLLYFEESPCWLYRLSNVYCHCYRFCDVHLWH